MPTEMLVRQRTCKVFSNLEPKFLVSILSLTSHFNHKIRTLTDGRLFQKGKKNPKTYRNTPTVSDDLSDDY
jgi:hypothetical protein